MLGAARPTGAELIEHELVRHITFTGSVATGRSVGAVAAQRIVGRQPRTRRQVADDRVCRRRPRGGRPRRRARGGAQLGAVLLRHHPAARRPPRPRAVRRSCSPSGWPGLSLGHGLDEPDVGPLISAAPVRAGHGLRRLGPHQRRRGRHRRRAAPTAGGGHFVAPTLLQGVRNDMPVAREEIFGPVQSVLEFDSLDEAVAIANDTEYGLSAGIFTRDVATAHRVAAQLQAGQVQVNRYTGAGVEIPFGGYKNSGLGREKGIDAVHHYTQVKSVIMDLRHEQSGIGTRRTPALGASSGLRRHGFADVRQPRAQVAAPGRGLRPGRLPRSRSGRGRRAGPATASPPSAPRPTSCSCRCRRSTRSSRCATELLAAPRRPAIVVDMSTSDVTRTRALAERLQRGRRHARRRPGRAAAPGGRRPAPC